MKHEDVLTYLDDYLDGSLSGALRVELEAELEASAELRAELEDMRRLHEATAALPRTIEPPRDLWSGIAARIDAGKIVRADFTGERTARDAMAQSPWQRWGLLAAAAMLLVATSSGITAYLVRPPTTTPIGPSTSSGAAPEGFATVAWDQFRTAETEYQKITDEILEAMDERRDQLDPETIRIVEESLRLIDQAIEEARTALERDPSNGQLAFKLNDIYKKRVDFLLQMNRL